MLARRYGDFYAAEDATQRALLSAAVHWPAEGIPENPRGWLIQTGSRKLLDRLRGDQARRHRESLAAAAREMAGDDEAAMAHYRTAAARTTSVPERQYLATQAARLNAGLRKAAR